MRAPPAHVPVRLALQERRVREKRGRHRLQRQRHTKLLHHVRLGGEIEVHLHRAGAPHHLGAQGPDGLHVGIHQLVAPLGHQRHLLVGPDRRRAQPDEARADLVGDLLDLAQVLVHLVAGLVDGLQRCAGQFQLPARLQAHIGTVLDQSDDVATLFHRRPSEAVAQPLQHGADRTRAVIGQRQHPGVAIAELLVLRADAPAVLGLAAGLQIAGQVCMGVDRTAAGLRNGHEAKAP